MGLDMHLYAEKFLSSSSWGREEGRQEVKDVAKMMGAESLLMDGEHNVQFANLRLEIAYWRKANQVHNYFVNVCGDGEDNCQDIYVEGEQLKELLSICKRIQEDHSLAQELLPTQSGFLFGSTEYDEWYFQQIDYTVEILEKILPAIEVNSWDIYYRASW